MRDELRSLGVLLLAWFTLITGFITLWWFLSSGQPLAAKIAAGALLCLGTYSLVLIFIVKLREQVRYSKRINNLEREIRLLEQQLRPSPRDWRHSERRRRTG